MTQYDEHRQKWDRMSSRHRNRLLAIYAALIVGLALFWGVVLYLALG